MKITQVTGTEMVNPAFNEGAVIVVTEDTKKDGVYCVVMTHSETIARNITRKLGWVVMNRALDRLFLYAYGKRADEVIEDLQANNVNIYISPDLADLVSIEAVQSLADSHCQIEHTACHGTWVDASLVPVSFKPEDVKERATGSAVLTLRYRGTQDTEHYLCYIIYEEGTSPKQGLPNGGPHLSKLFLMRNIDWERLLAQGACVELA